MPSIGRIQSTNFQGLLDDLGITRNQIPFDLRSEVSPVVLVGGTVSFVAAPTPAYDITDVFTAGPITDPIAATLFADTGPLPVGAYTVTFWGSATGTTRMAFEWRNAANSADLWSQQISFVLTNNSFQHTTIRLNIQTASERFRVTNVGIAAPPGSIFQASILAKV